MAGKRVLLAVGVALLLGGLVLVYVGVKPLAPLLELFTGGAQAAQRHEAWLQDLEAHLGRAALPVGLGMAALLAGFVAVQMGLAAPKPPPVEDLVRAEVERRLAAAQGPPAHGAPQFQPAPPAAPAAPTELGASAPGPFVASAGARRTHCVCGSVLVAGGRLCPRGHRQA